MKKVGILGVGILSWLTMGSQQYFDTRHFQDQGCPKFTHHKQRKQNQQKKKGKKK